MKEELSNLFLLGLTEIAKDCLFHNTDEAMIVIKREGSDIKMKATIKFDYEGIE